MFLFTILGNKFNGKFQFLFIEGADIPNVGSGSPYKIKETIRNPSPGRGIMRTPSPNRARLTTATTTFVNGEFHY